MAGPFTDDELAERWFDARWHFPIEAQLRMYTELCANSASPPRWTTTRRAAELAVQRFGAIKTFPIYEPYLFDD